MTQESNSKPPSLPPSKRSSSQSHPPHRGQVLYRRRSKSSQPHPRRHIPASFTFIKGLAFCWLAVGSLILGGAIFDLMGWRDGPGKLPENKPWIPLAIFISSILTLSSLLVIFRTKLGFYLGLMISFFMLLAIPIGTVLGIISIKAYMDGKDAFGID